MLYRKFYETLIEWKNKDRKKALFICGARQTGKTTLIREFGRKNYKTFLEINFITSPSAKEIFNEDLNANTLIAKLTAFFKKELVVGETLVFFDEVQECLQVRTAIKFLIEDGRFDYIESGSLLGVVYQEVVSFPVGFEEVYTMYPMSFEEFAIALGVQNSTFKILKQAYESKVAIDDFIHKEMMRVFRFYCVVGGMPAAVNEFVESNDMAKVLKIQESIIELYRKDVQKYAKNGKDRIQMIFDAIPAELNNKNKRFILSDLKKTARSERYESCFNWLSDAGVTLPSYNLTELKQPLGINLSHNLFKCFLNDTGLLCAMSSSDVQFQIINNNLNINEGSIMENVIATQLKCNGYKLYYYDRKKFGEIDFVVEHEHKLLPIEIKSGKDYRKHPSLNRVIESRNEDIHKPIVFCIGNIDDTDHVLYLPLYMVMYLENKKKLGILDITLHI